MSTTKKKPAHVSSEAIQSLNQRIRILEHNFTQLVVDLTVEESKGRKSSDNFWLVLIAAYFLAGIYLGRQIQKQKYEEVRKRRE
jgi:hypothetical protein